MFIQLNFPGGLSKLSGKYQINHGQRWIEIIESILGNDFHYLFDLDNQLKPFLAAYVNNKKIVDINKMNCNDGDNLMLLCAISGG